MNLEKVFKDIHEIQEVLGCLLVTEQGELAYVNLPGSLEKATASRWADIIKQIKPHAQLDAIFGNARIYIRKTGAGFLILVLEVYANMALIKLQCDVLESQLVRPKTSKGLKKLFKK